MLSAIAIARRQDSDHLGGHPAVPKEGRIALHRVPDEFSGVDRIHAGEYDIADMHAPSESIVGLDDFDAAVDPAALLGGGLDLRSA